MMNRLLKKYLAIFSFMVLASCDGSDCIDPADFGNLIIKKITVFSNPFNNDTGQFVNTDTGTSYVPMDKSCTTSADIPASSTAYHWLDTGIDIVSLEHKMMLKVAGTSNHCATIISSSVNEEGVVVLSESLPEDCMVAKTVVYAHNVLESS